MVMSQGGFDTLGSISESTIMMDDSIYQYFLKLIQTKPSSEVLSKIRLLLVEIANYPDKKFKKWSKT